MKGMANRQKRIVSAKKVWVPPRPPKKLQRPMPGKAQRPHPKQPSWRPISDLI